MENTIEFENLISLLESPNKDNFSLGLIIAQNYKSEFLAHFGCEPDDIEDLTANLINKRRLEWYGSIFKFTDLHLDYKNFEKFPQAICVMKKLQNLNLAGNQVPHLFSQIGRLQNLKRLDLMRNQLQNLPIEIRASASNLALLRLFIQFNWIN